MDIHGLRVSSPRNKYNGRCAFFSNCVEFKSVVIASMKLGMNPINPNFMRSILIDGDVAKKPGIVVDFAVNVRLQAIHIRPLELE